MGTLDPQELSFILDENMPIGIVRAMRELRLKRIAHMEEVLPQGVLDLEWMDSFRGLPLTVITNDRHLLTRPHERKQLIECQIGVIITSAGDKPMWHRARDILRHWGELMRIQEEQSRPFAYKLSFSDLIQAELL